MPTWLVHGFRWPRPLIRIHIILQNLDDCAAEWTMAPLTSSGLIENFKELYPEIMPKLESLRFIEQYDPEDIVSKDQPYAFVCDQVHEVQLSVDIDEVRGKGVANDAWGALVDLRDKLAPGEKVGWFVVVNGDVERWAPPMDEEEEISMASQLTSPTSRHSSGVRREDDDAASDQTKRPKGIKNWFKARRAKSYGNLRSQTAIRSTQLSPPLPNNPIYLTRATNGKAPVPAGTAV
ncbi:hypothetical protein BDV96DRAFT_605415 [Lophiotrema nucula]|uniref:Developmental regulator protein n=1 Tax=Lophiotrema nucula TaxID=690887 RepID=A0A6A5YPM3_9PLEO|nr:hypothetical protein BDV96DRAFT_605415 [Lophiotrema nucula]